MKIVICSNIYIDYCVFTLDQIQLFEENVEPFFVVNEIAYSKWSKSGFLLKLLLRVCMYLVYPFRLFLSVLFASRKSVYIVTSNGFFAPYLVAKLGQLKGIRVIHFLLDLFPDALEVAGFSTRLSTKSKLIELLMRHTQKSCSSTVYLGDYLREHAECRIGKPPKSFVIDIASDCRKFSPPEDLSPSDNVVFHYGGQLGYMHDAQQLAACIRYLFENYAEANQLKFQFYIRGAQSGLFKDLVANLPVEVHAAIPSSEWRKVARGSDVGLVSLIPGASSVCLPSKTYAMMASGMAIIGICPIWSDLANLILKNKCGWIINNSPFESLKIDGSEEYYKKLFSKQNETRVVQDFCVSVAKIHQNLANIREARENSLEAIREKYSLKNLSKKWEMCLQSSA